MFKFAFSPFGDISIDEMRIALINYIVSRQKNERFIVQIEDIDKNNHADGKDQEMLDLLKKFAIEQDQLLYQSDNLGRYQQFALSLIKQGKAFACVCETEDAQGNKKKQACSGKCLQNKEATANKIKDSNLKFSVYLKKPNKSIQFTDKIKNQIKVEPDEMDDFLILKTDGMPEHSFATSCADMLTDISTVIRNEEHISSTPKEVYIKQELGYTVETEYAHLSTICDKSTENNGISIKSLIEDGFLPDAIINYLLGIDNKTPVEIFTLPDAIEWFDLDNISSDAEKFSIDKLKNINRKHLENMEDKTLSRIFGFADDEIGKLLKIYLKEASIINELDDKLKALFGTKKYHNEYGKEMQVIANIISESPMIDDFDDFKDYISSKSGLQEDDLLDPLSILITGSQNESNLSDIYPLIKPYITEIARCTP